MNMLSRLFLRVKLFEGYFYLIIFISLFIFIIGYFYTKSHYVDISNLCNIAIDKDFLKGNSKTIFQAIDRIKNLNQTAYKDVCKYVDLVSENFCPIFHTYGGPLQYNNQPGCYIKSSKVIYLNPDENDSEEIIDSRAEAIKTYANLSKIYWSNTK